MSWWQVLESVGISLVVAFVMTIPSARRIARVRQLVRALRAQALDSTHAGDLVQAGALRGVADMIELVLRGKP